MDDPRSFFERDPFRFAIVLTRGWGRLGGMSEGMDGFLPRNLKGREGEGLRGGRKSNGVTSQIHVI